VIDTRDGTPIYAQLNRALGAAIAGGRLRLGDQLPTVRPRTPRKYWLVALGELSGSRMSKWVVITVIVVVVLSRISALRDFWRRR
jgi:hypothetical protein